MVKYEWKKIFSRTGGRAALVLLFIFVGITCLFAADISRVDKNGESQTGPAAEAKDQFTEQEKAYLVRQYETVPTPFSYDYITGWKQLFTFAPTVVMLTMLVLGYLVAGIFSGEFAQRADAVFFTSVYGRDKAVLAKIQAGFLAVTSVYFAAFLLYTAAVLLYLGADGWNLAVQVDWRSWKCFYHFRIWQKYLLILVGGYLGCLFLSFLGMLVSAKTRSSVPAVMVPVLLIFLPSFLGNLDSPVVSKVIRLLPDQLLQAGQALDYFELYTIGGKVLGTVPILLTVYTVLTVLLLPALYQGYRRKEIG